MRDVIEKAAAGNVSGSGAEWSDLLYALRHYGEFVHENMMSTSLRTAARRVCVRMAWNASPSAAHGGDSK